MLSLCLCLSLCLSLSLCLCLSVSLSHTRSQILRNHRFSHLCFDWEAVGFLFSFFLFYRIFVFSRTPSSSMKYDPLSSPVPNTEIIRARETLQRIRVGYVSDTAGKTSIATSNGDRHWACPLARVTLHPRRVPTGNDGKGEQLVSARHSWFRQHQGWSSRFFLFPCHLPLSTPPLHCLSWGGRVMESGQFLIPVLILLVGPPNSMSGLRDCRGVRAMICWDLPSLLICPVQCRVWHLSTTSPYALSWRFILSSPFPAFS